MKITNIPVDLLRQPQWNPNQMDGDNLTKLGRSIDRYGLVQNLVVRHMEDGTYEMLAGNQRLQVLSRSGINEVPCVVVELGDGEARLLCQALNRVHGEDDLGLRAELLRRVLEELPEEEVLAILPDTRMGLEALVNLGHDSMGDYLRNWEAAQAVKLKHLQFQLTGQQLEAVEEALARLMPEASNGRDSSPNTRGTALYLLCRRYLEMTGSLR